MNKRIFKSKVWIIIIVILVLLFAILTFISYVKFEVRSPFAVMYGVITVNVTNTNYVKVQKSPRVVIAKPRGNMWGIYLTNEGYVEEENERLGSRCIIRKGEKKEAVFTSVNKYYSKFIWEN
jgi:hypothetical protein